MEISTVDLVTLPFPTLCCFLAATAVTSPYSTSVLSTETARGKGEAFALGWDNASFVGWEGNIAAINTANCVQQIKNLLLIILIISMGRSTPGNN